MKCCVNLLLLLLFGGGSFFLGSSGLLALGTSRLRGRSFLLSGSGLLLLCTRLETVLLGILLELFLGGGVHVCVSLFTAGNLPARLDPASLGVLDEILLLKTARSHARSTVHHLGTRTNAKLVQRSVFGLIHLDHLGLFLGNNLLLSDGHCVVCV